MKKRYISLIISTIFVILVISGCFLFTKTLMAPKLVAPVNGATNVSTNATLSWTPSNVQAKYELFFGTDKNPLFDESTSSTSIVEKNLDYSTTYYWKVVASANGKRATSSVFSFTTSAIPSPSTPVLYVSSASTNSVPLKWTKSEFAASVEIYEATSNKAFSKCATLFGSSTSYTASNLSPSTVYRFFVVGINTSGRATSDTITATTLAYYKPVSVNSFLVTSVSTNTVTLGWKTSNASFVSIYSSPDDLLVVKITDGSTSYTVDNLKPYTSYKYFITAVNPASRATSETITATTLSYYKPALVNSFSVTSVSTNTVTLGWETSNASFVSIYSSPDDSLVIKITDGSTSYTVNNLKPSTSYKYFITAVNPTSRATSETITATTLSYVKTTQFGIYVGDKPVPQSDMQHLYVTFTGFSVHATVDGTSEWYTSEESGTYDLTTLAGTFVNIANLSVPSSAIVTQIRFDISSATVVINGTSYSISIPSSKIYLNAQSLSAEILKSEYLDFDLSRSIEYTGNGYIFTPVIHVTGANARASVTGYVMYKSQPVVMATVSIENSSTMVAETYTKQTGRFTIGAVNAGDYTLRVDANSTGLSEYSTMVSLSVGNNDLGVINLSEVLPATPVLGLSSKTSSTTRTAILKWTSCANADGYRVWESTSPTKALIEIADLSPTATSYTVRVEPGSDYYFIVSSYNSAGQRWSKKLRLYRMPTVNSFSVTSKSTNTVTLGWKTSNASFVSIYLSPDASLVVKITDSSTSYTVDDLKPYTSYKYFIVVVNPTSRATSETITATTLHYYKPVSVNSFSVTSVSTNTVTLGWNTSNASAVSIYSSPDASLVAKITDSSTSHTVNDLEPYTSYKYFITAVNPKYSATSETITATTLHYYKPVSVNSFSVSVSTNTVTLGWNTSNASSVSIYSSPDDSLVAKIIDGSTFYHVNGLDPSTSYKYFITAVNPKYSATSETITATTASSIVKVYVGTNPYGIAVDPTRNRIYVANYGSNNVSVIDGNTNKVIETIPVGSNPKGIAVDATRNKIYVANYSSNNVSVIDGNTNTVVATITVGTHPLGIAVSKNFNFVYVANFGYDTDSFGDGTVSIINTTNNTVKNTVQMVGKNPSCIAVVNNSGNDLVYVTNYGGNNISVIFDGSLVNNISPITGSKPMGIVVNPNKNSHTESHWGYVANSGDNTVSVMKYFNGNDINNKVPVGNTPMGIAMDPTKNRIYVANHFSNTVSVIDGTTSKVIATVQVGVYPLGIAVDPTTHKIYVVSGTVSVIDGNW